MKRSSEQGSESVESSALRQSTGLVSVGDAALVELHGLRSDVRELIALLRGHVRATAERPEATPPKMTIAAVAESCGRARTPSTSKSVAVC